MFFQDFFSNSKDFGQNWSKLMKFSEICLKTTWNQLRTSFLRVKSSQESISVTFRSIWDRFFTLCGRFCPKSHLKIKVKWEWNLENHYIKCSKISGKQVLALKLSGNDVLTSTSYWESFRVIAHTFGASRESKFWKNSSEGGVFAYYNPVMTNSEKILRISEKQNFSAKFF